MEWLPIWPYNSETERNCPVFRWHSKIGSFGNSTYFHHKSLIEDVNKGPLNNILLLVLNLRSPSFDYILICYSGHGLDSRPFTIQTCFNHLNIALVWNLKCNCISGLRFAKLISVFFPNKSFSLEMNQSKAKVLE